MTIINNTVKILVLSYKWFVIFIIKCKRTNTKIKTFMFIYGLVVNISGNSLIYKTINMDQKWVFLIDEN